jgi:hypothetical protein
MIIESDAEIIKLSEDKYKKVLGIKEKSGA